MFGTFTNLSIEGPDDVGKRGVWLRTTSVEPYATTISSWCGINSARLDQVFPSLINFTRRNLNFM